MQILVLAGSPREDGNSALLAGEFAAAAREKGHEVTVFRAAAELIHGCLACERCWENGGAPCIQKDAMQKLYPLLNLADMVVFASPLYCFGLSAQLKAAIDRFYPFSKGDKSEPFSGKRSALILCGGSSDENDFEGAVRSYELLTDHLGWEDAGILVATDLNEKGEAKGTEWMQAARDLALDL